MRIRIERTECFGSCPIYEATFDSDGAVYFNGKGCVSYVGSHKQTVPRFRFLRALKKADQVNFKSFKDSYDLKDCITDMGDLPSTTIAIYDGRTEKTVSYYLGCMHPSFPELSKLEELTQTIELETGINRFVDVKYEELKNCES